MWVILGYWFKKKTNAFDTSDPSEYSGKRLSTFLYRICHFMCWELFFKKIEETEEIEEFLTISGIRTFDRVVSQAIKTYDL